MARPKQEALQFDLDGKTVPIKVFRERRWNTRIAKGATSFLLRIPKGLSQKQEKEAFQWAFDWIRSQLKKKPDFLDTFQGRSYQDGDLIHTTAKTYRLNIQYQDRASLSGKVMDQELQLKLPQGRTIRQELPRLISRLVASDQLADFSRRVYQLNELHFQERLGHIRLKYTQSRWGSCSGKGNLNFSTRLLKATPAASDYVIIHELAHLKEMNHSARFWAWVEQACPNFKVQEKWLKENRDACDF